MGFMQLYTEYMKVYSVETSHGTEIVPYDLVGEEGDLHDYLQGEQMAGPDLVEGWFARYSANGYLDCTDWVGPCETEEQAIEECKELYGDDNGDA